MAGRLTDKQKKKIIADYIKCRNYSEIARKYGLSPNGVKKIVQNDPDSAEKCSQKANEEMQDTLSFMQEQHDIKKRILVKILEAMEKKTENVDMFTNIKDLATAYGIIIDKEFKYIEAKVLMPNKDKTETDPLSASLAKLAGEMENDN